MNKQEFLEQLRKGLYGLPEDEIEERLGFYSEIIDDCVDEGVLEEQAVEAIGNIDEIVSQIVADTPFAKIAIEKIKKNRRMKRWEITLLVLGSPVWLSLILSVFAFGFSLYISIWTVIVSLWSVFVALVGSFLGGAVAGILVACCNSVTTGFIVLSVGIICGGLSVFAFFGCKAATKGCLLFTGKFVLWLKNRFMKKEDAQ